MRYTLMTLIDLNCLFNVVDGTRLWQLTYILAPYI